MNNSEKILSILGLCRRAGRLESGELGCEIAIKEKKAKLLILAKDASENTTKKFVNSADFYNIDIVTMFTKAELGYAIGKDNRAVIAVTDDGFKNKLLQLING